MIEELLNDMKTNDTPADAQVRFVLYLMDNTYGGAPHVSVNLESDKPYLVRCTCKCPTCERFSKQAVYEPSSELFLAFANYCKQREDFAMVIGQEHPDASVFAAAAFKKGSVH